MEVAEVLPIEKNIGVCVWAAQEEKHNKDLEKACENEIEKYRTFTF